MSSKASSPTPNNSRSNSTRRYETERQLVYRFIHLICLISLSLSDCLSLQVTEGDGDDTDLQIFCVSCSHPVNPKVALRHMERCYAKVSGRTETQTRSDRPDV